MAEAVGAVIVIGEDVDAFGGPIMSSIERTAGFTDVVSTSDWKLPQTSLVLISSYGTQFEFIGLVHRSGPVATGKRRVRVFDLEPFDPPGGVDEILSRIPERFRRPFEDAINSGSAVPPATWAHVLDALIAIRPDLHPVIERLRRLATPKRVSGEAQTVVAQERDAVNLALRASGFDPARLVDVDPDVDGTAPFLTGLREASITEDQAIGHDAGVFGSGWRMLDRYQVGTAVFEQEGTRLTVMNVNRTKVERTLGVDLLYYHHRYRSYVLVQYKSMRKEGKVLGYRPAGKVVRTRDGAHAAVHAGAPPDRVRSGAPQLPTASRPVLPEALQFHATLSTCSPIQPMPSTGRPTRSSPGRSAWTA